MTALYIIITLILLYLIFIVGPAVTSYFMVFRPKESTPLTQRKLEGTYFEKYRQTIESDFSYFASRKSERVNITADDGAVLYGDLYRGSSDRLMLCIHGYGATPLNCFASYGRFLREKGWSLLMIHQRGHGDSSGISTMGVTEQYDVIKWAEYCDKLPWAKTVAAVGVSMGCASLAYASDKLKSPKLRALILDCGFTSPYSQLTVTCKARHLPHRLIMPIISALAKHILKIDIRYPTWKFLENNRIPCLFIHGESDSTVPLTETETNFTHCAAPKRLVTVPCAEHACSIMEGGEALQKTILDFIEQYERE